VSRVRQVAVLTAAQIITSASSLAATVVTSATLGLGDRGAASFVLASVTVLSVIATFGLYVPVSTFRGLSDRPIPLSFLMTLVYLTVGIGLTAVVASALAPGLLTVEVGLSVAALTAVAAPLTFAQRVLQARVSSGRYLLLSVLSAASLLAATAATSVTPRWQTFVGVFLVGQLLTATAALSLLVRDIGFQRVAEPVFRPSDVLKMSAPIAFGLISQILLWRGDTVALGLTTGNPAEVAVYSIAAACTTIVWLPVEAIALLLYRELSGAQTAADASASVRRLAWAALGVAAVVAAALIPVLVLVVHEFLPAYKAAIPLYLILVIGVVPASSGRVLFAAATAVNDRRTLRRFTLAALASILIYVPATATHQAMGAAVASVALYLLTTALLVRVLPLSSLGNA
jgi:O-antigen/teichoic acid export membrane protein